MLYKDLLEKIRDQDMDRKEFLKYTGLVLVGLTGFKTIISLLSQTDDQKTTHSPASIRPRGSSYGS